MFISEVDEQVLKKTGQRWVFSAIGGEPLARELIGKGVRLIFHVLFYYYYVCAIFTLL